MTDDLTLAHEMADMADRVSMASFRSRTLQVIAKADLSPVSEADRAIGRALWDRVSEGRQGSAGATWRWVIDPIDGTRSFVRGNETWATLIALQRDGENVVAVASAPAMRLRFHATLGGGSFLNGRS